MVQHSRLKNQRGSTRIIWCAQAQDLAHQAQQLYSADVSGICIESLFAQMQGTLEFLRSAPRHYSAHNMPALMLSLSAYQRTVLRSVGDVPAAEGRALSCGQQLWIHFTDANDTDANDKKVSTTEVKRGGRAQQQAALHLSCPHLPLAHALEPEDLLYWGYGDGIFKVLEFKKHAMHVQVEQSGMLPQSTILYAPGRKSTTMAHIEALKSEDFLDAGVNYFVLPGCLDEGDVQGLRKRFPRDDERSPWLIYRVDSAQALECFEAVLPWVDGLMISRRELALTAHPDRVPMVTKTLIHRCRQQAKLTIVASQMLGSMLHHITPTRAEVSDVANAVYDGADAVMISEDTLQGPYALQAIEVAHKVTSDVEEHHLPYNLGSRSPHLIHPTGEMDVICVQAARTARRIGAQALVCITQTGNTAVRLSSLSTHLPIIAITFHRRIARKLRLLRGVDSLVLKANPNLDEVLPRVNELLKSTSWLHVGDSFVFVTVTLSSMSREASNLFTIQSIY